jgi:formylmethanofuran:tetrahydromethanopterin formyltransferase
MPGLVNQATSFRTISVKKLHPSYGAEIVGADFHNMSDEQFQEIKAAMAKVPSLPSSTMPITYFCDSMVSSCSATRACQTPNM